MIGAGALERVLARVDRNGPTPPDRPDLGPCWLWTGYQQRGYGRAAVGGVRVLTHRFVYERLIGPIPQCRHGHPFDETNTHIDSRGRRSCRACGRLRQQQLRARAASA